MSDPARNLAPQQGDNGRGRFVRRAGRSQSVERRWYGERQGDQGPGVPLNPNDPRSFPRLNGLVNGGRIDTNFDRGTGTDNNVLPAVNTETIATTVQGFVDREDRDGYILYMAEMRLLQNRIQNQNDVLRQRFAENLQLLSTPRQEIADRRRGATDLPREADMASSPRERFRRQREEMDQRSLRQRAQLPMQSAPPSVGTGENIHETAPSPLRELEREYQDELEELQEMEHDARERGTRRRSF